MKKNQVLAGIAALAAVLGVSGQLSGCGSERSEPAPTKQQTTPEQADAFVADFNAFMAENQPRWSAAWWLSSTYITDESQLLASMATEQWLEYSTASIDGAKQFLGLGGIAPQTERALSLIRVGTAMPAPNDAEKRAELARIAARMEANYGSAKWCPDGPGGSCMTLQEIEKTLNNEKLDLSPQQIAQAWVGWQDTARPIRADYQRFVELMNEGAREIGFADTGELWRGGYDMSPAQFEAEVERLWGQVKPLYEALHCQVRAKLSAKYGADVVPPQGLIPAHLLGNMWAQQWSNLYPLMEPYPGVDSLDVGAALRSLRDAELARIRQAFDGEPSIVEQAEMEQQANAAIAVKMTRIAEDFYTSLGMPALPDGFWTRSLLVQPRDRDVVCHASAWDFDLAKGDVRIKQCIEPTEEQLITIHHELGHIYYYLNYKDQPPVFRSGAHDGFHEAIGDTVALSLTPAHLQKIGLVDSAETDERALINAQMRMALDKITFLPWGKLVDQWRWKVFSGQIPADGYNQGWWDLRAQYQGVAPPVARTEADFDPGAKYHIPGNTPYTRYFLAFVLQFQMHKALCEAAGHVGPLSRCDIYGNPAAGERFMKMLAAGSSQPWQQTLKTLTGSEQMDASALIEYFEPLLKYLEEQNQGQTCGWPVD